tara:strand:+ start:276 stop:818 length:543 start_codon:yes stop_codon:yes gene_type:complete
MQYFEKVFHVTVLAAVLGFLSSLAHAGNITTTGEVIRIEPIYTQVSNRQPKQVCGNVDVPVYGSGGNNNAGANALAGMIIGGILGKGVTGKDNGAAAGAVIGGIIGADKAQNNGRQIIGYRSEYRCSTQYQNVQSNIVNEYRVTYNVNGHHLAVVVNSAVGQRAYIGQRKQFRIRYQLLN